MRQPIGMTLAGYRFGVSHTREGDRVRFQVASVFFPSSGDAALSETGEVEGTIIGFSDSGNQLRAFAVVEVIRKQTVVVPTDQLSLANPTEPESEQKH